MLNTLNLGFVSGLIPRDKLMAFERVLFRATRGIVFIKQTMIEDPFTDPVSGKKISDLNFCDSNLSVEKNVFVVFYSGERAKAKIMKICDAFGATHYPFTEELGKQAKMITEVCIIIFFGILEDFVVITNNLTFYLRCPFDYNLLCSCIS